LLVTVRRNSKESSPPPERLEFYPPAGLITFFDVTLFFASARTVPSTILRSRRPGRQSMCMLDVYITVDTEVWPRTLAWSESDLAADFEQDVYGRTDSGE